MDIPGAGHRKRVKHYNIPGHAHFLTFSTYRRLPLLTNDPWRSCLAETIRAACDKQAIALWAYVFMPEHVHLLVKPRREVYDISRFLAAVKKPFSDDIIASLKSKDAPLLEKLRVRDRPGRWVYHFWQEGSGYDLNIFRMELAEEKADYSHNNPAARGLVKTPADWRWSSYRWLRLGERGNAPLVLDEWEEFEQL